MSEETLEVYMEILKEVGLRVSETSLKMIRLMEERRGRVEAREMGKIMGVTRPEGYKILEKMEKLKLVKRVQVKPRPENWENWGNMRRKRWSQAHEKLTYEITPLGFSEVLTERIEKLKRLRAFVEVRFR